MGQLVDEVKQWNTPLVGAFLLWRFTQGYCEAHPEGQAPVALFHFLAAAILTNRQTMDCISARRDSLQSYIRGFEENKASDILLGVQKRIIDKRKYTLEAIDIAVSSGLLVWDVDEGTLYPCELKRQPRRGNALKPSMMRNGDKAAILGKWFSAHDLRTVAAYMEVVF
ncbi:MAG: hypothetical protein JXR23_01545 [Pontiellaceae bacterium]|nr:hypothetical protein [Pontiellaceae bacterium]